MYSTTTFRRALWAGLALGLLWCVPAVRSATKTIARQIYYTATGTGGTERTQHAKNGDTISVKDFGAKGDNSTDDTVAINAAIQAAVNAQVFSGCVYFPAGRYMVTGTIKMYNTASTGSTADGICLYGDNGLASQIRWNTTDVSKPVVSIHAASARLDNIAIDMLGDALAAIAYDGDVTIGRSTMGGMRNIHINCENHLGDGIQLGAGTSQADMLEIDHPQIENCSQGSAIKTFNANVLNTNVVAPFFNHNWIGYNVNDSSNVHVFGGGHDAHDLVVKKNGIGTFEMFGARSEGPKRVFFDSAAAGSNPVTFIGLRVDSMNVTRANVTGTITTGTNSLTLSAAGYTFGDQLVLSTAGAAGATLKVTVTDMADPTHVTVSANASTTMTGGAIGFYGYNFAGARCTVSTTNTSTAVTFSSPWCMNPGEFITIVGAGLTGRQITSCSTSTACTMQNPATATLPTATWFNAGSTVVPQQPQDAFHFQALGPYTIIGSTFGGATATNITGGGGAGASSFNITGNFWNTDPGNSTPWSSPQLPSSIGATASNNVFGTTIVMPQTLGTVAFASLPSVPPNGSFLYCSDCTIANPCAAAGTGAFAKRINAVWVCN